MVSLHVRRLMIMAILLVSAGTLAAQTTSLSDLPCGRLVGRYSLILFDFDSDRLGAINQRILREHVYADIVPGTAIEVIGHTDIVGLDDHNLRLTRARANNVAREIRNNVPAENITKLTVTAVGESAPIYTNMLPEGRFYNRTVQVLTDAPAPCE